MLLVFKAASMRIDRAELRKGVAETRRYLLAHHPPSEFYRCYSLSIAGRRIRICARCVGIYPGIIAGLLAYFFVPSEYGSVLLVGLLPLPALIDWGLTTFSGWNGFNLVRTTTGMLLGCGYGFGLSLLFLEHNLSILAVGIGYALLSGLLLSRAW
jgi:uncharacterized membrane protein